MRPTDPDTNQLVQRAAEGDPAAAQQLLRRHRARLRRMVALRMDPRLAARIDPSDGVQDALIEAHNPLPQYLAERRIPFYPWLRRLAWNRLVALYRQHVQSGRRSVTREQTSGPPLSEESVMQLVDRPAIGCYAKKCASVYEPP